MTTGIQAAARPMAARPRPGRTAATVGVAVQLRAAAVERVEMNGRAVPFRRESDALRLTLPGSESGAFVPRISIYGRGLV